MRTVKEILERIEDSKSDIFGFSRNELITALPFEDAKPFLEDTVTSDQWTPSDPRFLAIDYLPFAWEKANNCRGLSAMRAMDHYNAWCWLLEIDILEFLNDYTMYGKAQLVALSTLFDYDWRAVDNGKWVNEEGGPNLYNERIVEEAIALGNSLK